MTTADDPRAVELAELARHVYVWLRDNDLPGLPGLKGRPPSDFHMHAGIYRKVERGSLPGTTVRFWDDPEEERRLRAHGLGVSHVLLSADPEFEVASGSAFARGGPRWTHENEVLVKGDLSRPGAVVIEYPVLDSRRADADTLRHVRYASFAGLLDRVDLVWDDLEEALRVRVQERYRWLFDYARPRTEYAKPVSSITPLESDVSELEFRRYMYRYATYSERRRVRDEGGSYYPKWREPRPLDKRHRDYRPTKLSSEYLRECWHEHVLQKDRSYLLIEQPDITMLYLLSLEGGDALRPARLDVKEVLRFSDHRWSGDARSTRPPIWAVIFHAIDGARSLPAQLPPRGRMELRSRSAGRHAYDYRASVRWFYGDAVGLPPDDDKAWFELFADTLFPDLVYPIDRAFANSEHGTFSLDELVAQAGSGHGPLTRSLADDLARAGHSSTTRFVVKGMYYGASRAGRRQMVGVGASGYVYEWNVSHRIVTRMPLSSWLKDNETQKLAAQVYEGTRVVIPFAMAVTFGGVAVAGGAAAGAGAALGPLSQVARTVGRELIKSAAAKKLTRQAIKQFRAQLIALLADGILKLVPRTDSMIFEFLRGFVHGFGAGAIDRWLSELDERFERQVKKLYRAVLNRATMGVRRAYQVYAKLNVAIQRLVALFQALDRVWTDDRARALAQAFGLLGQRAGLAFLLALVVAVYVDEVSRTDTDREKRDLWARKQSELLQYMIKETGADIAAYAEVLHEEAKGRPSDPAVLRQRNERIASRMADAIARAPREAPVVAETLREFLAELGIKNWDELTRLGLVELLALGVDAWLARHPDFLPHEARVLGTAVGELIGTIFLERAVMPAKWRKVKDPRIRGLVAGGTARALLHFVRHPVDRILEHLGGRANPTSGHAARDLFEWADGPDTAYREVLNEALAHNDALSHSLLQLAEDASLAERIRVMAVRARSQTPPTVAAFTNAGLEDPAWPRDAVTFLLSSWLQAGIQQIFWAYETLEDRSRYENNFRLATLLEILGLDVQLDDIVVSKLTTEFDDL